MLSDYERRRQQTMRDNAAKLQQILQDESTSLAVPSTARKNIKKKAGRKSHVPNHRVLRHRKETNYDERGCLHRISPAPLIRYPASRFMLDVSRLSRGDVNAGRDVIESLGEVGAHAVGVLYGNNWTICECVHDSMLQCRESNVVYNYDGDRCKISGCSILCYDVVQSRHIFRIHGPPMCLQLTGDICEQQFRTCSVTSSLQASVPKAHGPESVRVCLTLFDETTMSRAHHGLRGHTMSTSNHMDLEAALIAACAPSRSILRVACVLGGRAVSFSDYRIRCT